MCRVSIEFMEGRVKVMLWEHEPQASVSTAFSSSPKRLRVFRVLLLDRNTENMFSISFRKYHDEEKEKQLVYFDHQNVNSLCSRHHYVNNSS